MLLDFRLICIQKYLVANNIIYFERKLVYLEVFRMGNSKFAETCLLG